MLVTATCQVFSVVLCFVKVLRSDEFISDVFLFQMSQSANKILLLHLFQQWNCYDG